MKLFLTAKKNSLMLLALLVFITACVYPKNPQTHNYNRPVQYKDRDMDSTRGYLNEMRTCYDVKFYHLDLSIWPKKKSLGGVVEMRFEILKSTQIIQIELAEEFDIAWIKNSQGEELNFVRDGRAVYISFPMKIVQGSQLSIFTSYSGRPKIAEKPPWRGGLVWKKTNGIPFVGVACEDDGASIWWPLKDHISDKPDSVRMSFDVPEPLFCVSNGKLISAKESAPGRKKFVWQTSYPINQYNVTFYLGPYDHFTLNYKNESGDHPLDFYVLPENFEKAKKHFRQTAKVLEVFEKLFGPYPWWKDGFKMVESPYEGMEHQTAIAYGSGYKNGKWIDYDYILVHETAHEWWGNAVTVCDMADLWLHEGFATYAEALYMEAVGDEYDYSVMTMYDRSICKNKRPVVGPAGVAYTNYRDGDIYSKGSVTLHTLRTVINNDSVFFNIIYRFGTEYRDQCVVTQDFVDLVNDVTADDYSWLFEQLIFRPEAPELVYYYVINSRGEAEFIYRWNPVNTNRNFRLPVEIEINEKTYVLYPTHDVQTLTLNRKSIGPVSIDNIPFYIITEDKKLEFMN